MKSIRLAFAAALLACAGPDTPPAPAGLPYITGMIESLTHRATASGVLVRSPGTGDPCGIVATVDARTRVLRRSGSGSLHPALAADLREGAVVEVYVEGPVAESCPAQGHASSIVIVER